MHWQVAWLDGVDTKLRQLKSSLDVSLIKKKFEVFGEILLLTEVNAELRLPGCHQFGLAVRTLSGDASRTAPQQRLWGIYRPRLCQ